VGAGARVGVDDAQRAVLRDVDVFAVVLHEVGLVDAGHLVVGPRAVGGARATAAPRRRCARRGRTGGGGVLLDAVVPAALAAGEGGDLVVDALVHSLQRDLAHERDRLVAIGERNERGGRVLWRPVGGAPGERAGKGAGESDLAHALARFQRVCRAQLSEITAGAVASAGQISRRVSEI
jgi:hypothetical protein